jgi:hypothetical protein
MSYYLDDLERDRYAVDDSDSELCHYCKIRLRCKDDECEIVQCPECGFEP